MFGGWIGYWVGRKVSLKVRSALHTLTSPAEHRVLGLLGRSELSTNRVYGRFSVSSTTISQRLSILGSTSLVHSRHRKGFVCCRLGTSILRRVVL